MIFITLHAARQIAKDIEPYAAERCGFILGIEHGGKNIITKILPVKNNSCFDKLTTYAIAAVDYILAEELAEKENIKLMGVYHSHPNHVASPSAYDINAAQPNFIYIIFSVINKKMDTYFLLNLNTRSADEVKNQSCVFIS